MCDCTPPPPPPLRLQVECSVLAAGGAKARPVVEDFTKPAAYLEAITVVRVSWNQDSASFGGQLGSGTLSVRGVSLAHTNRVCVLPLTGDRPTGVGVI